MSVPIADQIEELEREIRQRERLYPGWVENGLANPPRRPAIKLETVEELAGRLLDAIASDNLVDAVIDDGRRASASIAAFS